MCTVSMIGDHYNDKWKEREWFPNITTSPSQITIPNKTIVPNINVAREEFDELKREVAEMKALLIRAKKYDKDNNEPDCEMDEKVALLKKVAELVGVDLSEVFGA